jgi:hypothetical protein
MRVISALALPVALLLSSTGCGGGNSSTPTSPTPANTASSIAPSLGVEINASFLAAMRAGGPVASLHSRTVESLLAVLVESLLAVPMSAQSGFVGSCSRGGTVTIQSGVSTPGGGRVVLTNSLVIYSNCTYSLNGRDVTVNGTLTGNGTWTAAAPSSPVQLSGNLTANEIGIVPVNGSTGAAFNGSIGGITVGTPAPAPTFDGTYTGTSTGSGELSQQFFGFTVAGGVFTVPFTGGLVMSGTVSASGAVAGRVDPVTASIITVTGQLTLTSSGGASAVGTYDQPAGFGDPHKSGTWAAIRTSASTTASRQ